jgi:D-glycero-D-manno-heptose 1,7-bisphosphate phosphatase
MRRAVFLDRDGVLNEAVERDGTAAGPRTLAELRIDPEAPAQVARLGAAGWVTVVVTNQPDVARGLVDRREVDRMHERLRSEVAVDAIYVCPHDGREGCACRKPAPGMLHDAARDLGLDLAASWLVGDRWVDIASAAAAGVRSVLLEHPLSWNPTSSGSPDPALAPTARVASLRAAVDVILGG